ncbi:hypothetical protein ACFFLM_06220 [Deinococcus oregonensis]|uniref:Uncharacterized protein n=1 Tax=Deinococcus oregonensis TaxID=1805970 RepID=A0ABV6AVP3_9DEIO
MKAAAWELWVTSLPLEPLELQQVAAGLRREVKQMEGQLIAVLATGGNSRVHRETLIELAELNSKLRLLEAVPALAQAEAELTSPLISRV